MIAYLNGKLFEKRDTAVVIDVQGVGYEVFCSPGTIVRLGDVGNGCQLFIHTQYRTDGASLFGFASTQEKALFLSLIKVDSVGPKSALNIMAGGPWEDLVQLIEDGDVTALSKLPKISRKTAEHLVVKLKGKLSDIFLSAEAAPGVTGRAAEEIKTRRIQGSSQRKMRSEASTALTHLGYRSTDVERALEGLSEEAWSGDLQTVIRHALNDLSGGGGI